MSEVFSKLDQVPDSFDNVFKELRGKLKLLTIRNFVSVKFDNLLVAFRSRCPHVELQIDVAPRESISLAALRNEADIGITAVHAKYHGASIRASHP